MSKRYSQPSAGDPGFAKFDPATREAFIKELNGADGTSGCNRVGRAELDKVESSITTVMIELNTQVDADPRTRALDEEWSACMRRSGYQVERPTEVVTLLGDLPVEAERGFNAVGPSGTPLSSSTEWQTIITELELAEMRVAKADADCGDGEWFERQAAIRQEYLDRLVKSNEDLFRQAADLAE